MQLLLASSSTRRRELLKNAGFEFEVCPSKVQEVRRPGEIPEDYVRRAAREKALDVAGSRGPGTLVLGADTVVDCDGQILEKPVSPDDAARMLRLLSGRAHRVITGVCLVQAPALVEREIPQSYRIIRSSPSLRVTRSRSRYSSKGMAYFRLRPVISLNVETLIRASFSLCRASSARSFSSALR